MGLITEYVFRKLILLRMSEPSYSHQKNDHYLIRIKGEVKCICELCDCGKHKCPTKRVIGDFQTSYNNHYQNFTVTPQPYHHKYNYNERHYNPETLRTNYQETYIPLQHAEPATAASRLQSIGRVVLKSEPFVSATSYKDEYKPFKIQNASENLEVSPSYDHLKDSRDKPMVKFEGESSYKSAHHSLPIPKLDRYKQPEYKPTKPFQGSSSYKDNYVGYRIEPSREIPKTQAEQKQIKFQGSSTYNKHYGTFKVAAESNLAGPCRIDQLNLGQNRYLSSPYVREIANSSLK